MRALVTLPDQRTCILTKQSSQICLPAYFTTIPHLQIGKPVSCWSINFTSLGQSDAGESDRPRIFLYRLRWRLIARLERRSIESPTFSVAHYPPRVIRVKVLANAHRLLASVDNFSSGCAQNARQLPKPACLAILVNAPFLMLAFWIHFFFFFAMTRPLNKPASYRKLTCIYDRISLILYFSI